MMAWAWLFAIFSAACFGCLYVMTLRDLGRVERERDALWDELHGPCITQPPADSSQPTTNSGETP